jgi:hypothetical protein
MPLVISKVVPPETELVDVNVIANDVVVFIVAPAPEARVNVELFVTITADILPEVPVA